MGVVFGFISLVGNVILIGYSVWIAFWKPEVTMKDLAFMGFIVVMQTIINEGKLKGLESK